MGLELSLFPLMPLIYGQSIQRVRVPEISHMLARTSRFKDKHFRTTDIIARLNLVNRELYEHDIYSLKEKDREDAKEESSSSEPDLEKITHLRNAYLLQVGMLSFINPVLQLDIPPILAESFENIAQKRPYNVKSPLDVYFIETAGEPKPEVDESSLCRIYEQMPVESYFARSDSFKRTVAIEANLAAAKINKRYSPQDHFAFVCFFDFCAPVFNIPLHHNAYLKSVSKVLEQVGVFGFAIPEVLKE